MKQQIILLLILLAKLNLYSQIAFVDGYIKKINDKQFTIIHKEKATFNFKSKAAYSLIKKGKRASEKLVIALNDSSKIIMAHLILCHIYFGLVTFAGPKINTINDKQIAYYFLGNKNDEGLIISEVINKNNYELFIEQKHREAIKRYWKKKIASKT